jgi:tetratricopeptide (TPR) repeat protein/tRNA A-37 threonylcarbamoyl transferase component Bud32
MAESVLRPDLSGWDTPVPSFVDSTPLLEKKESDTTLAGAGASVPRVPGYEILRDLGEGGMGVVYLARQVGLKRLVALKMIRATRGSLRLRQRFRREAESVARLQHANIVQIYEVGEASGEPFLSLEYVEGTSLDRWLDGRPLPPVQAARLLLMLARAIQFAHDRGVVHRDLKPANILLAMSNERQGDSTFGIPKIADFGLAMHLDDEDRLSHDGDILGTPAYMAPEQAAGRTHDIGPHSDVYALGAILYELLTGRAPFVGLSAEETVKQVCEQEPVPPRRLLGRLPRDLDTICLKCLEKAPTRRYGSAADLAEDLRRFLDGEAVAARPSGLAERALRWARRRPAAATLLGCLLLAVVVAAGAVSFHIQRLRSEVRAGQDEIRRLNRASLRERIDAQLRLGRLARDWHDWADARLRFTEALDNLDAHLELLDDDLRRRQHEASTELSAVVYRIAVKTAEELRRRNYRELFHWRDEAFFLLHRDLFTPAATSPADSLAAADHGLALFGMTGEMPREPDLGGYTLAEQDDVKEGLFELLLIRAEAVARSAPAETNAQRGARARQALATLDRAAPLSADSSILHRRRARYLRQRGQTDEAESEQRRAEALTPRSALGWFLYGHDLGLEDAHRAEAIRAFDEALRRRSDLFWAHFLRALAYQKQGVPAEAHASLTVCISRRERFVWSYLLRGLVRIELGELSAARQDFDRAEALASDAASRYVLHLNRGTLALKQADAAAAIGAFEKAMHEKPELYQAYANLAEAYARQDRLPEAVGQLNQAIEREPANAGLYRARALLEQRAGDRGAALADLERAIHRTPRDHPALELARYHFERGAILFLDNQFRPALQALDESLAVELSPGSGAHAAERERLRAATHLLRAQTLWKLKEYRAARDAFDEHLKHGPATAALWRQRAAVSRALKDYKDVLEDCTRALGLEPDAETFLLRGSTYLHFQLPGLAVRDFDEAIRLDATSADAYLGRGLARVQVGDAPHAVADARLAVKRSPKSPQVRVQAARILARAGDHQTEALKLLRSAAELIDDPDRRAAFWDREVRRDRTLASIASGSDATPRQRR